ncbi:SURF1 family protein [Hydrogenophaga sp.]|uniref:SURF1 family protein n=1 Tax=Hydrogenophaga sp. TaxID=1904254 RepID=UPI0025BC8360|nr:SURF1 family protein [Hydrogenophaga sp.]
MSTRGRRFWVVTAATVLTLAITASLGRWQLDRAAQKEALQAKVDQRSGLPALNEQSLLASSDLQAEIHRSVRLRGQWLPEASVFLDNRQMNGRTGFFLVTPLRLSGSDQAVLVQRGWTPRDFTDRSRIPVVDTPAGEVVIDGRLAPPPAKLYELGEPTPGPIRQNIDVATMAEASGLRLLDASVMQTGDTEDGLLREWPRVNAGVQKHYGYAVQWFALFALAALLYLWFQILSPRRKPKSHGPAA